MKFIFFIIVSFSLVNCVGVTNPTENFCSPIILFYVNDEHLDIMNFNGSMKKSISDIFNPSYAHGFSKDGKYIYYSANIERYSQLFLYDLKTEKTIQLTKTDSGSTNRYRFGDISEDSQLMTYYGWENSESHAQIFLMNLDDRIQISLTSQNNHSYYRPILSPDRTKIAFTDSLHDLYIMNIDGTELNKIAQYEGELNIFKYQFDETSNSLYYCVEKFPERIVDFYKINLTTDVIEKCISSSIISLSYKIFPNESKIYYEPLDNNDIYCMNFDGSELINLTEDEHRWCLSFDVSFSHKKMVYSALIDTSDNIEIFISNLDGSNKKRLTFSEDKEILPKLSP